MLSRQEFFALARERLSTEELYSAYEAYATCPALKSCGPFYCERCGACCRRPWRIEASEADLRRWIMEKRLDVIGNLKYSPRNGPPSALAPREAEALGAMCPEADEVLLDSLAFALAAAREGALVMLKDAGGCAYYDGSGCTIYDTRPEVCARFPDVRLFEGLSALVQQH